MRLLFFLPGTGLLKEKDKYRVAEMRTGSLTGWRYKRRSGTGENSQLVEGWQRRGSNLFQNFKKFRIKNGFSKTSGSARDDKLKAKKRRWVSTHSFIIWMMGTTSVLSSNMEVRVFMTRRVRST